MIQLFLTLKNSEQRERHARVHSQSIVCSFIDRDDQMNVPKCTSHLIDDCTLRLEIHNKEEEEEENIHNNNNNKEHRNVREEKRKTKKEIQDLTKEICEGLSRYFVSIHRRSFD